MRWYCAVEVIGAGFIKNPFNGVSGGVLILFEFLCCVNNGNVATMEVESFPRVEMVECK